MISYSSVHTSCLVGIRTQIVCVAASWPVPASWSCWSYGSSCPMYKYYTGSHLTSSHSSWLQLYNVFYCIVQNSCEIKLMNQYTRILTRKVMNLLLSMFTGSLCTVGKLIWMHWTFLNQACDSHSWHTPSFLELLLCRCLYACMCVHFWGY